MSPAFPSLRDKHHQPDLQNNSDPICFRSNWLFNQESGFLWRKTELCIHLLPSQILPMGRALPPPSQASLAEHSTQVKQEQHNMEFS